MFHKERLYVGIQRLWWCWKNLW